MKRSKIVLKRHHVSPEGFQLLNDQLRSRQEDYSELRSKLSELRQVKDADDFDLVEDTVRLAFLEKEVQRIQNTLAHCKIVHTTPHDSTIQIGSKVRLEADGKQMECVLVSAFEADPSQGKISNESPLGRAILGKMIDAIVEVVAPRATRSYKIVGILS